MSDVKNNIAQNRYELEVDGKLAFADYSLDGSTLYINHVETPAELRGGGVAGKVMAGVVEDAKKRGLEIIPICGYAAIYLKRHPV